MERMNNNVGYPVQFSIDYPDRPLNRLTTLLRIFIAIPIIIVLGILIIEMIPLVKLVQLGCEEIVKLIGEVHALGAVTVTPCSRRPPQIWSSDVTR